MTVCTSSLRSDVTGEAKPSFLAFHHAGGSQATFVGWKSFLAEDFEFVPVGLPEKLMEGKYAFEELIAVLDEQLTETLGRPHVLFGQSMGAVIAYRLACRRANLGTRQPERLVIAGCASPLDLFQTVNDYRFDQTLAAVSDGQLPGSEPSTWPVAQRLHSHLQLLRTYVPDPVPHRLGCRFDVFVGESDPLTSVTASACWATYTQRACHVHVVGGGHLVDAPGRKEFLSRLRAVLSGPGYAELNKPAGRFDRGLVWG